MKGIVLAGLLLMLTYANVSSQTPVASFTVPAQACLGQNIIPDNHSSGASTYEWDFCQGDLALTPSAFYLGKAGGFATYGIDVALDGNRWIGFITSRDTKEIIRLDFGTDLHSTPVYTNLGNISGVVGRPVDIKIVKEAGSWYAFTYSESTAESLISRINFGNSLMNTQASATPVTADVILPGNGVINSSGGFDMVRDVSGWTIVYTQPTRLGFVHLSALNAMPSAADLMISSALPGTDASSSFGDIRLVQAAGSWFAYTTDFINKNLYRLNFGATVFSLPSTTNLGNSLIGTLQPYGLDLGFDNGVYQLLLSTYEGSLIRVNLGNDLNLSPVSSTPLGNFNLLQFSMRVKLLEYESEWLAFTSDYTIQKFYRVQFPTSTCHTAPSFAIGASPSLHYTSAGPSYVTLHAFDADGYPSESSALIDVQSGTSPVIDFQHQNSCAQFPVDFTVQSALALHNYQWDFGNGDISAQPSPSETFSTAGNYSTSLTAVAANGCSNLVRKIIPVYAAPVADFVLPSPALSCSNQLYDFINTSTTDAASSPTWQWNVNGAAVSTTKDLLHAFTTITNQSVQLVASLPGCSTEKTQSFNIQQQGPVVDFDFGIACESQVLSFTNNSSGNIAGYTWDFGDGNNSSATAPNHTYNAIGKYDVTLTVSNPLGCNNTTSKALTVFSTPQPAFSLDLPPFSCSGTPSQLVDETPNMTDSNIALWSWDLGDGTAGVTDQSPVHTFVNAAMYPVSLNVTTDRGCSASTTNQITIAASPIINFSNTPACLNHETKFTDASEAGVKSWTWVIDGTFVNQQNTAFTFNVTGDHNVQLTATANNNCIGRLTKTISVPLPPILSFSVTNPCKDSPAIFINTSDGSGDPVNSLSWDFMSDSVNISATGKFIYRTIGTFDATLVATAVSGCVYTQTNSVEIFNRPTAYFTPSIDEGTAPLSVIFLNKSTGDDTFLWNFGSSESHAANPTHVFVNEGTYDVMLFVSDVHGCSDTTSHTIKVEQGLTVKFVAPWPNPAVGDLKFAWVSLDTSDFIYTLTTSLGQSLGEVVIPSVVGYNEGLLSVGNMRSGVYLLTLKHAGAVKTFRVIRP